jgi:hypothetical protein
VERLVFEILAELERQTLEEVALPPEDKRDAYAYGHVGGRLYSIAYLRQELNNGLERQAEQMKRKEREFDAS